MILYLIFIIVIFILSLYHYLRRRKHLFFSRFIDIVYTWVDGNDNLLKIKKNKYLNLNNYYLSIDSNSNNRFRDNNELKYSIRSINKYVKWVNNIYIVTDNQIPEWLNIDEPNLYIVDHTEIFQNKNHLPTFNSNSIECNIPYIKGLSNYYIYMNDDFFFGKKIEQNLFFNNDKMIFYTGKIKKEEDLFNERNQNIYKYQLYNNFKFLRSIGYNGPVYTPIHQATIYNKDIYIEFLKKYENIYEITSSSNFRNKKTYHINGILPFYQFMIGKSEIRGNIDSLLVSITNNEEQNFIEFSLIKILKPSLFCIEDDIKNKTDNIGKQYDIFFESVFPEKSNYEI